MYPLDTRPGRVRNSPKDTRPAGSKGALGFPSFTPSYWAELSALSRAACQPLPARATPHCPLTSGALGLHACAVLLGGSGQLGLRGQRSGQGQQPRGTAAHQPRRARGEGHRGGVMRQRLELLLLERREGGPGAGGARRHPRPETPADWAQGPAAGARLTSPGQPGRPASPALAPAGPGVGSPPPRAGARMTHPDEAVQFPHGHLLGSLHGL